MHRLLCEVPVTGLVHGICIVECSIQKEIIRNISIVGLPISLNTAFLRLKTP